MKNSLIFVFALLVLSFVSCTEDISDCSPERPEQACDLRAKKLYNGSGKIYMEDNSNLKENWLEVGYMNYGKVTLTLPENVDSRFLAKLGDIFRNTVENQDVEALIYKEPLRLINDSGQHIEDLVYLYYNIIGDSEKIDSFEYHRILYLYFSEDTKIESFSFNLFTLTDECEYNIDAKKGWNKIYMHTNYIYTTSQAAYGTYCYTTDLSKVPYGLMWVVRYGF